MCRPPIRRPTRDFTPRCAASAFRSSSPQCLSFRRATSAPLHEVPSAADLKFLHWLRHTRLGTSNRKAALEIIELVVPLCFRSSYQGVLQRITNFGSGALQHAEIHQGP